MGKGSRNRKRREPFGGLTPTEYYWRTLGHRCLCGRLAGLSARMYTPLSECKVDFLAALSTQYDGQVPIVETREGRYVRTGESHACHLHASKLEKEAAKHPSSWFVDFDRGPEPKNIRPQVAVPRGAA